MKALSYVKIEIALLVVRILYTYLSAESIEFYQATTDIKKYSSAFWCIAAVVASFLKAIDVVYGNQHDYADVDILWDGQLSKDLT